MVEQGLTQNAISFGSHHPTNSVKTLKDGG